MEINLIGPVSTLNASQIAPDARLHVHELKSLGGHPVALFKFLRRAKKCMILYWVTDDSTAKKLGPIPHAVLVAGIRTIIKKPGGPAIVVEDRSRSGRWRALGDFQVGPGDDRAAVIKRAYFASECGHPSAIYREPMQRERVQWLKDNSQGSILEIGCSTGVVLDQVGGGTGVDVDDLRLEYARQHFPKCRFMKCDAAAMPFKDREFDTVMIPDILEHVEMDHAARIVRESVRVGKRLLITVPNAGKPKYDKRLVENPEHRWFPTEKLMRAMVGEKAKITFSSGHDFIYVTVMN